MSPTDSLTKIRVEQNLLDRILSPYKKNCRYLKQVVVEVPDRDSDPEAPLATARGEFEIPQSWYIDDTGHFNAIEFNICYNQLVYVLIGQCVASQLIPELSTMTLDEYRRRQLPDVLIVKFSSTFRRAMDALSFRGSVSIHRAAIKGRMLLLKTTCDFADAKDGFSEGEITLAIINQTKQPEAAKEVGRG